MNRIPPPSRPKSTRNSRVAPWAQPDPVEIEELAHSVWLQEGAPAGLEPQYRREVTFQLQLTRHLLASELSPPSGDGPAEVPPA